MGELLQVLAGLLGVALVPLIGFAVVFLARRRPWLAAIFLGGFVTAGVGAVGYAAALGYGFRPDVRRVEFDSEAARDWFGVGYLLLTLGCPAILLVVIARTRNGTTVGPHGIQWVAVLYGYWLACLIWGSAIYSWLTGQMK